MNGMLTVMDSRSGRVLCNRLDPLDLALVPLLNEILQIWHNVVGSLGLLYIGHHEFFLVKMRASLPYPG